MYTVSVTIFPSKAPYLSGLWITSCEPVQTYPWFYSQSGRLVVNFLNRSKTALEREREVGREGGALVMKKSCL